MLSHEIVRSDAWKGVVKHLNRRLVDLRELNDRDHNPTKTAEIRGQISEVKRMLALGTQPSAGNEEHPE